jgi:hypothetical protein
VSRRGLEMEKENVVKGKKKRDMLEMEKDTDLR